MAIKTVGRKKTENNEKIESSPTLPIRQNKKVLWLIGLVAIGALLYYCRSWFVVAIVNGQPITRLSLISELEKQSGKKALDSLITQTVILQEAKKQNIVISDKVINDEIKTIEKSLSSQGQTIATALAAQGMTLEQLKKQIRLQKILEKMVASNIKVTEKEIDAFMKANEASMPKDTDKKTLRKQVSDQLKQDKITQKIQSWVESHEKKANIQYFKTY